MKKCIDCGKTIHTSRRCQLCGNEVDPETGKALNFCLLCGACFAAIEEGRDVKQYREKKRQRMKRCAECINDRET